MEIEKIVTALSFEKIEDDMFADFFSQSAIQKVFSVEEKRPQELPKDYLWYLENYGCRTAINHGYMVQVDVDTAYVVLFEGLNSPQDVMQNYRYQTCTGPYAYRRKEEPNILLPSKFLPIYTASDDKMLVMDFVDDIGAIWQFPSKEDCKNYGLDYQPVFLAKSLTAFLLLLKPATIWASDFNKELVMQGYKEVANYAGVWKKNALTNTEFLYQLIEEHEKTIADSCSEFKNEHEFLAALIADVSAIEIKGTRAAYLMNIIYPQPSRVNNLAALKILIQRSRNQPDLDKDRSNPTISKLEPFITTGTAEVKGRTIDKNLNYYKARVSSTISGLIAHEDFIFYKCPEKQLFSFVRRTKIAMDNFEIKEVATFAYNYSWSSTEAVEVSWVPVPAMLHLAVSEAAFTELYFDFIRKVIKDITLKSKFEQLVFDHYQKNDFPEYLEMSDSDKDFFGDGYPKLNVPSDIWKLIKDFFDIRFLGNQKMQLDFDYAPDDEHGLTVMINNGSWSIKK